MPGIPVGAGGLSFSPRQTARMASLAFAQERREVDALRALGWEELEPAVGVFDDALAHLDAFARSQGAAADERGRYDVLLERWRGRAGALGLDVCSRFGFSY